MTPRVFHFVARINCEASGPSQTVPNLAKYSEIAGGGDVVHFLCTLDNCRKNNIHPRQINLGHFDIGHNFSFSFGLFKLLSALLFSAKKMRLKLVHIHGVWGVIPLFVPIICVIKGIPYIVSPRGSLSTWAMGSGSIVKKFLWPMQYQLYKRASLFHTTSRLETFEVKQFFGKAKCVEIPNGVDLGVYKGFVGTRSNLKIDTGIKRTLVFMSRLHPKKGLDELLEVWPSVSRAFPEWCLLICGLGDRSYTERVKRMISSMNSSCRFVGPVFGKEKMEILSGSDLMILPTYSENFGVVVAESLGVGTPVIVGENTPWKYIDGKYGFVCKANTTSIRSALRAAFSTSPKELQEMGFRGRQHVIENFCWDRIGHQAHIQIYERFLNE